MVRGGDLMRSVIMIGILAVVAILAQNPIGPSVACGGDLTGTSPNCTVVSIGGKSVSLANSLTTAGNFPITLTASGATNITLPTSGTLATYLSGTTSSIGGAALLAGACTSGTVTVTGATTGMGVIATPATFPGLGSTWYGYVSSSDTVTVSVCAIIGLTTTTSTYNVRVLP